MCELCAEVQERDIHDENGRVIGHVSGGIIRPAFVSWEPRRCWRCGKRVMLVQDHTGKRLLVAHDGTTHC